MKKFQSFCIFFALAISLLFTFSFLIVSPVQAQADDACGLQGNACCKLVNGRGSECANDNLTCENTICVAKSALPPPECGIAGKACCDPARSRGKACLNDNLRCENNLCIAVAAPIKSCGVLGKDCCPVDRFNANGCGNNDNLKCSKDNKCIPRPKPEGESCDPANNGEDCQSGKCVNNKCEEGSGPPIPPPKPPCANAIELDKKCYNFHSALGRISTDPGGFIASIFGVLLAASGAIALLLIMRAGYRIMVSEGNPEKVKEGRDQLIAAIVGLLFLIFAFVFLQLIGFDILRIPGFGGSPAVSKPVGLPKGSACQSQSPDPGFVSPGDCASGLICGDIDPSTCFDTCQGTCK